MINTPILINTPIFPLTDEVTVSRPQTPLLHSVNEYLGRPSALRSPVSIHVFDKILTPDFEMLIGNKLYLILSKVLDLCKRLKIDLPVCICRLSSCCTINPNDPSVICKYCDEMISTCRNCKSCLLSEEDANYWWNLNFIATSAKRSIIINGEKEHTEFITTSFVPVENSPGCFIPYSYGRMMQSQSCDCVHGINCFNILKTGDKKCIFYHSPEEKAEASRLVLEKKKEIPYCKFGAECHTKNCTFKHDPLDKASCKFGVECYKKNCVFSHPARDIIHNSPSIDCINGAECYTKSCTFVHPQRKIIEQIPKKQAQNVPVNKSGNKSGKRNFTPKNKQYQLSIAF